MTILSGKLLVDGRLVFILDRYWIRNAFLEIALLFQRDISAILEEDLLEQFFLLLGCHERYRFSLLPGAGGPSDAVGVRFHILRDLVVVNM